MANRCRLCGDDHQMVVCTLRNPFHREDVIKRWLSTLSPDEINDLIIKALVMGELGPGSMASAEFHAWHKANSAVAKPTFETIAEVDHSAVAACDDMFEQ